MISHETWTSRLLRETAHLLNFVAEAAWTNDSPPPVRWELHRIGTDAHLAQRDILNALGREALAAGLVLGIDTPDAIEEAAHTFAAIPAELHKLRTARLQTRASSPARGAIALAQSDADRTVVRLQGSRNSHGRILPSRVALGGQQRPTLARPNPQAWGSPPPTLSTGPGLCSPTVCNRKKTGGAQHMSGRREK